MVAESVQPTVKLEDLHDSLAEATLWLLRCAFDEDNNLVVLVHQLKKGKSARMNKSDDIVMRPQHHNADATIMKTDISIT